MHGLSDRVMASATLCLIRSVSSIDAVSARTAINHVLTVVCHDAVVTGFAVQGIFAGAAFGVICTASTSEYVVLIVARRCCSWCRLHAALDFAALRL
jgi:hypothetical protein